jgi:hypothetical protein
LFAEHRISATIVQTFGGVELRQVTDLAKVLRSHLGRLVPDDVPPPEAEAMWDPYDEIERCAVAAKTLLAARVDESRTWARWRPVGGRVHGMQGRKLGG